MHSFPKTGSESCWKKNPKYDSNLYNSTELSVDWTSREFQNQAILFSRKMKSLTKHNPEVTESFLYMFLPKQLTSKRTYFLKSNTEVENSLFYFQYYRS